MISKAFTVSASELQKLTSSPTKDVETCEKLKFPPQGQPFSRSVARSLGLLAISLSFGFVGCGQTDVTERDGVHAAGIQAKPNRPTIVLITIDTLRADHLSFYGYERETAPFLASLANESLIFTNAYSTSSWTLPAVVSMLTGLYPQSHGVVNAVVKKGSMAIEQSIPPTLPSLAAALKEAGYATYAVTANGHLHETHGFARGFDRFTSGFLTADQVNAALLEWKAEISEQTKPVFIWLHYFDPHTPYSSRQPWVAKYAPEASLEEMAEIEAIPGGRGLRPLFDRSGRSVIDLAIAQYDSEINYCDEHIRQIFAELPFLDQAVTIVSSDHGEEFMEHGDFDHGNNLYNETTRIPLVIRIPGGKQAFRSRVVSLIDVGPTLLALAGAKPDRSWQGMDLLNTEDPDGSLKGRPDRARRVIAHLQRYPADPELWAAAGTRWKTISGRAGANPASFELYDLESDPGERKNLGESQRRILVGEITKFRSLIAALPPRKPALTAPVSKEMEEQMRSVGYLNQ